jgi:hypothetical protein
MGRTVGAVVLGGGLVLAACNDDDDETLGTGESTGGAGGDAGEAEATGEAGSSSEAGAGGATASEPVWGIDCDRPEVGARSVRWEGFERGLNLGNRLESPAEGDWGPQRIFDGFEQVEAFIEAAGVPIYNGEFTAQDGGDLESRATWIRLVREECERRDIGWAVWEDGTGGNLFDHSTGEWNETLLDALMGSMSEAASSGQSCPEGVGGEGGAPGTVAATSCEDTRVADGPAGYDWCLVSGAGTSVTGHFRDPQISRVTPRAPSSMAGTGEASWRCSPTATPSI